MQIFSFSNFFFLCLFSFLQISMKCFRIFKGNRHWVSSAVNFCKENKNVLLSSGFWGWVAGFL